VTLRQALVVSMVVLLALDLIGGVIAVASDVNDWSEAWSGNARLAAPWPMILLQVSALVLAVGFRRPWAIVGGTILALACLVSGVSGFFDGAFAAAELGPGQVAFQVLLLGWTAVVGLIAAAFTVSLVRRPPRRAADSPAGG
jgi:hypothetical protein